MTTTTPYSDEWRARTLARMRALNIWRPQVVDETGIPNIAVFDALHGAEAVSIETTGPIDELLDKLEAASDAHAVEHGTRKLEAVHAGEAVRVERLAVSLDPLTNMNGEVRR